MVLLLLQYGKHDKLGIFHSNSLSFHKMGLTVQIRLDTSLLHSVLFPAEYRMPGTPALNTVESGDYFHCKSIKHQAERG